MLSSYLPKRGSHSLNCCVLYQSNVMYSERFKPEAKFELGVTLVHSFLLTAAWQPRCLRGWLVDHSFPIFSKSLQRRTVLGAGSHGGFRQEKERRRNLLSRYLSPQSPVKRLGAPVAGRKLPPLLRQRGQHRSKRSRGSRCSRRGT